MFDARELRFTQIQRFGRRSKTDAQREAEQAEAFRALQNKGKKTVAEMLAETRVAKHAEPRPGLYLEVAKDAPPVSVDGRCECQGGPFVVVGCPYCVFGDGAPGELAGYTAEDVTLSVDGVEVVAIDLETDPIRQGLHLPSEAKLEDIEGGFRIVVPERKDTVSAPPVPEWLKGLKKE
jgi:hypothetical protein